MRKIRQPIASRNDGPPMITQKGWITIIIILMALCLFASYLILDYTLVNIQLHAWDGHQIPHNGLALNPTAYCKL